MAKIQANICFVKIILDVKNAIWDLLTLKSWRFFFIIIIPLEEQQVCFLREREKH